MASGPERVQNALDALGLQAEVIRLPAGTRTAQEAAQAVGCDVGAIAKSLLFLADGEPLLVICGGDKRVDTEQVARLVGARKVEMAPAGEVRRITGYAIGGVPPVGHATPIRKLFDSGLLLRPIIYAAGGAHDALFSVDPRSLAQAGGGEIAEV